MKVLFKSERTFKRPMLMVCERIESFVMGGIDFSKLILTSLLLVFLLW